MFVYSKIIYILPVLCECKWFLQLLPVRAEHNQFWPSGKKKISFKKKFLIFLSSQKKHKDNRSLHWPKLHWLQASGHCSIDPVPPWISPWCWFLFSHAKSASFSSGSGSACVHSSCGGRVFLTAALQGQREMYC